MANPAIIFGGNQTAKNLQSGGIQMAKGKSSYLFGTDDPTSTATSATIGSVYTNTSTSKRYVKQDAGSSTNWKEVERIEGLVAIHTADGTPTSGFTATGLSFSADTTAANLINGSKVFELDGSATGQTLESASLSIEQGRRGRFHGLKLQYHGNASDWLLTVNDVTNTRILGQWTISSFTQSDNEAKEVQVSFPTQVNTDNISYELESTANDDIYIDSILISDDAFVDVNMTLTQTFETIENQSVMTTRTGPLEWSTMGTTIGGTAGIVTQENTGSGTEWTFNKDCHAVFLLDLAQHNAANNLDTGFDFYDGSWETLKWNFVKEGTQGVGMQASGQYHFSAGQKIRARVSNTISATAAPTSVQITAIAQNDAVSVLSSPDEVYYEVNTHSGTGSTDTRVVEYTGTPVESNSAGYLSHTTTAANGTVITVLQDGEHTLSAVVNLSAADGIGFSRNSNQLTTNLLLITDAHRIAMVTTNATNHYENIERTLWCNAGDQLRVHTDATTTAGSGSTVKTFRVARKINKLTTSAIPFFPIHMARATEIDSISMAQTTNYCTSWDTINYDDSGCFQNTGVATQSVSTNGFKYVCPEAGRYRVRLAFRYNQTTGYSGTENSTAKIYVNQVEVAQQLNDVHGTLTAGTWAPTFMMETTLTCGNGDEIQSACQNNAFANSTLRTTDVSCWFEVERIK